MRTRIRHFRKLRGLTQSGLAARLGTTAATVSRLETADMTLSAGWLERIAAALSVGVAELLDSPPQEGAACLGEVRRGGAVMPVEGLPPVAAAFAARARTGLAFLVAEEMGPYSAGDILIADRLPAAEAASMLGRDCFAADVGGTLGFGRLVSAAAAQCLLMPPERGAPARAIAGPQWIAPVVTMVRHFPEEIRAPRSRRSR
ncbi:MAG: helix-turn-helix transcriptional regulator [Parvibaculum sp.]